MPCACSLPATTTAPCRTEVSALICTLAAKNATSPRHGLHSLRALILAILFIMLISCPLLVCAEAAQAGLENNRESHDVLVMSELNAEVFSRDLEQEETGAKERPKFWNRKFLRGKKNECDSSKKLLLKVSDISQEGRTLLHPHDDDFGGFSSTNRRMLIPANECTNKDISITQRRDGSPGIPRFSVQIVNTCMSDCAPADIHVYCGWFASSPPPNPNVFQRLSYNDCLVNEGRPLGHGAIIQFQYANSFMYPIRFRSARFCR